MAPRKLRDPWTGAIFGISLAAAGCLQDAGAQPRPRRDAGAARGRGELRPIPRVVVRAPRIGETVGGLSHEVIRRVVRRHQADLQRCHERALRDDAGAPGRISLDFTIGLDGRVTEAHVTGPGADGEAGRCLVEALRGWTFPAPTGGVVRVRYPLSNCTID